MTAIPPEDMTRIVIVEAAGPACDILAAATGLPKARVKDCMTKGGVWRGQHRSMTRLRRATAAVRPGERLEINYSARLLNIVPPVPEPVQVTPEYSIWHKPAGVLAQGTRFADHCSLPRLARTRLELQQEPHPVHRLDREARGLMLLAHDRKSAAALGNMIRHGRIHKEYQIIVAGNPDWANRAIELPLDGKPCRTGFTLLETAPGMARLQAIIENGRKHQIRRHLAHLGLPVLGDPRYGKDNSCTDGLQLLACALAFTCPFSGTARSWTLPDLSFPVHPIADSADRI